MNAEFFFLNQKIIGFNSNFCIHTNKVSLSLSLSLSLSGVYIYIYIYKCACVIIVEDISETMVTNRI